MCRGSSEVDSGSVVSCSHPEPRATILGKTRISRPRRKPGGLAGRAEYPGRPRALPGQARDLGRDAGTRGGAGTRAGDAGLCPAHPRRLRPLPACRRRQRRGRWEGEVARGSLESRQGLSPSWDWAEGPKSPLSHCCLRLDRKKGVHSGNPLEPQECWRVPRSTQPRTVSKLGRCPCCWGTNRLRKCAQGSSVARSPAAGRSLRIRDLRPPPLFHPELPL